MNPEREVPRLTPPEIARLYRVSPGKVLQWIRTGQLAAINVATTTKGRPRYLVAPDALSEFEEGRKAL